MSSQAESLTRPAPLVEQEPQCMIYEWETHTLCGKPSRWRTDRPDPDREQCQVCAVIAEAKDRPRWPPLPPQ